MIRGETSEPNAIADSLEAQLRRVAVHDQNREHVRHAADLVAAYYQQLRAEDVPEPVALDLTRHFGFMFWRRNYWPEHPW